MPSSHLERGRQGEELAAAWYAGHGYHMVARNWRCATGEVDLIVRRGELLVVCEVKARRTDAYGLPAAAVGRLKQQRLRRLAAEWLATSGVHGVEVRFDVVAVTGIEVEVIEGAF
jgi:putative endonuclease